MGDVDTGAHRHPFTTSEPSTQVGDGEIAIKHLLTRDNTVLDVEQILQQGGRLGHAASMCAAGSEATARTFSRHAVCGPGQIVNNADV
ncbi:hypothetical protein GOARA_021_00530 [Gordonia araii NBRC 100433]|uniref:Uncharacterized protein n=1 Tax=Gordonia araii NBRC 100433 TaxID=1073574 RepID=G7GYZ1_9ACTN|nr:hypothetical protein GOARA_021_00530 [Gordonia araii NBRC 100433]